MKVSPFQKLSCGVLAFATAALAGGCQRYEPQPLSAAALSRAMEPPAPSQLRLRMDELKHPLLPPVPIDFRNGLTPDAVAVVAVIANPSLRSQRDRRLLSQAQLLQARLLPNPSLDVTFDPVTGGNTQGAVNAYNVGVSYELTALIAHDAKLAAARAGSSSVQLDVAWQEWQFAQAAKKAAYDLVALQAQLDETATVDRQLAEETALVGRAVDAHQKTLLDLAAAQSASQKAHSDYLAARRDTRRQQLMLDEALGLPAGTPVPLSRTYALPDAFRLPDERELLADLENRRLDLLALRQGYESQEQTLRAAILAQFPKVVLGVHQASDNTGVQSTGFGVTIDLPIFDQNQGAIAAGRATRKQLFDEFAGRVFEARAQVSQMIVDIHALTDQIASAEAAVPKLERLVRTYQAALGQHNVDVLSYYTAQSDVSQARLDVLKLKQQLVDNHIALELAAGRYLPMPTTTAPASGPGAVAEMTR